MPPWENVKPKEKTCESCGNSFNAKRDTARFCSSRCQNRSRKRTPPTPEQQKEWRARRLSRPGYKKKINAQAKDRNDKIKTWLNEYKTSQGCTDCGYNAHPAALHFDHVRGKKKLNVCNAKSIAQAKREIKKCEVRCANCHSIRTYQRLQDRKSS
jgi:hypothetical protein